ncbi:MAG TPA: hypothetical protein VIV60_03065 [Polyangiaceae bacterium]
MAALLRTSTGRDRRLHWGKWLLVGLAPSALAGACSGAGGSDGQPVSFAGAAGNPASVSLGSAAGGPQCLAGQLAENGLCRPTATAGANSSGTSASTGICATLGCDTLHRPCETSPTTKCKEACVSGYIWEKTSKLCRPVKKCSDLACPSGQACREATDTGDAVCEGVKCTSGQGWDPITKICRACLQGFAPNCSAANLTGEVSVAESKEGAECVCETQDGYYLGENKAAVPCDADADGWVSDSAQPSIEGANPIVRQNAHCHVRRVGSISLQNEKGEAIEADDFSADFGNEAAGIPKGLPLYESARNDGAPSADPLPAYAGRGFAAVEMNSLTKACSPLEANDFNDNGVSDVDEHSSAEVNLNKGRGASIQLQAYYQAYTRFGYFSELHTGWYEDGSSAVALGKYIVKERPRGDLSAQGVPVLYPSNVGAGGIVTADDAQQCIRHIDPIYRWKAATSASSSVTLTSPVTSAGGDFSEFGDVNWGGMTHHSQYKCMKVVDRTKYDTYNSGTPASEAKNPTLGVIDPQQPGYVRLGDSSLVVNECQVSTATAAAAPGGIANSAFPGFVCHPTAKLPTVDSVVLGAVVFGNVNQTKPYKSFQDTGDYRRGCINECVDSNNAGAYARQLWPHGICNKCELKGSFGKGQLARKAFGQQPCDDANPTAGGFCDQSGTCLACDSACSSGQPGSCSAGKYRCDGTTVTCQSDAAKVKDCGSDLDNDCNGRNDREEMACLCDHYFTHESTACDSHPRYDGLGICKAGTHQCMSLGPTAAWSECVGAVPPKLRNCRSSDDNDCNGKVDQDEPECAECKPQVCSINVGLCKEGTREVEVSADGSSCTRKGCTGVLPSEIEGCGPNAPDANCNGVAGDGKGSDCTKIIQSGGADFRLFVDKQEGTEPVMACTIAGSSGSYSTTPSCTYHWVGSCPSGSSTGPVGYVSKTDPGGYVQIGVATAATCYGNLVYVSDPSRSVKYYVVPANLPEPKLPAQ